MAKRSDTGSTTVASAYFRKTTNTSGRPARLVNKTNLAIFLDLSHNTMKKWIDLGLPVVGDSSGKGDAYLIDTADAVKWVARQAYERGVEAGSEAAAMPVGESSEPGVKGESKDEADRRRAIALANIAEIEEAQAAGDVVPVQAVADMVAEEYTLVRDGLSGLGSTLAGRTASITSEAKIKEIADKIVFSALDRLVGDVMRAPDEDDDSDDEDIDPGAPESAYAA